MDPSGRATAQEATQFAHEPGEQVVEQVIASSTLGTFVDDACAAEVAADRTHEPKLHDSSWPGRPLGRPPGLPGCSPTGRPPDGNCIDHGIEQCASWWLGRPPGT